MTQRLSQRVISRRHRFGKFRFQHSYLNMGRQFDFRAVATKGQLHFHDRPDSFFMSDQPSAISFQPDQEDNRLYTLTPFWKERAVSYMSRISLPKKEERMATKNIDTLVRE